MPPIAVQRIPSRLHFDRVSFAYGDRDAVVQASFTCPVGVTALLGPNGAGKTTLMRVAATARAARTGTVSLRTGTEVCGPAQGRAARRRYRAKVGWLPQGFRAPGGFTASELVAYAGWLKGMSSKQADSGSSHALREVGLHDRRDDKVRRLSGGMLQRLGIAQAIVHEPSVLLLDEPTVGLDPDQRASFRQLVRRLASSTAVLVSTHLTEDVELMCDRVVVLDRGSVCFEGDVEQFLASAEAGVPPGVSLGEHAYRSVVARSA